MNPSARGPLYGLRVVDATDIRGAICGRLLADLGADVMMAGSSGVEDTPEHKFRNANKRSLGLDITKEDHRKKLLKILEATDVFIENLNPKLQREYGFHELVEHDPNLIHISISDFGLSGPHSDWRLEPLTAFSSSGAHWASGFQDLPPCWLPGFLAYDCASVFGAIGAVAGIMDRRRTGMGQMVEVSVQEAALHGMNPWSIPMKDYLKVNEILPYKGRRNADASYWVMRASDGWVRMVLGTAEHWRGFVKVLGSPDALAGEEWEDLTFRLMNLDVARVVSKDLLADRTRIELFEESLEAGTMIGPVHSLREFMDHPQTKFRNFFQAVGEDENIAHAPWKLSETPASLRLPAPKKEQGEQGDKGDRKDRGDKSWLDEEDTSFCPQKGLRLPEDDLVLSGIRIVEFGAAAVVPEMCWVLNELGAEIIKLESAAHPDVLRIVGRAENLNSSFAFNTECRGRKSVAININTKEGRELAFKLCAGADIVAENFRGGVLDGWGISYEALNAVNPEVIYISSQGYGRGGPMGQVPAFGPVNSAFAGTHLMWNHSEEDIKDLYPCGTSLNHPDHIAGKILSIAVLSALDYRAREGKGQLIDMAQTEAGAYLMGEFYMEPNRTPFGNQRRDIVPHNTYPASDGPEGIDRWVSIVAASDEEFAELADSIGLHPVPEKWKTGQARLEHRQEINDWISNWTKSRAPMEIVKILQSRGVPAMAVQGPEDHRSDPHLLEREALVALNHPVVGEEHHIGNPLRMSRTSLLTAPSAPCLGQHTEEVLKEVLGMKETEIARLQEERICF